MLLLSLVCADQNVNIEIHSGSTSIYTDYTEYSGCSGWYSTYEETYPSGKPDYAYHHPYGFTTA